MADEKKKGRMTVKEAGEKTRELVEKGKEYEREHGGERKEQGEGALIAPRAAALRRT